MLLPVGRRHGQRSRKAAHSSRQHVESTSRARREHHRRPLWIQCMPEIGPDWRKGTQVPAYAPHPLRHRTRTFVILRRFATRPPDPESHPPRKPASTKCIEHGRRPGLPRCQLWLTGASAATHRTAKARTYLICRRCRTARGDDTTRNVCSVQGSRTGPSDPIILGVHDLRAVDTFYKQAHADRRLEPGVTMQQRHARLCPGLKSAQVSRKFFLG